MGIFRTTKSCSLLWRLALCMVIFNSCVVLAYKNVFHFPEVVEVDAVFPRNGSTYAPNQLFPVVFAIQNVNASEPLYLRLVYGIFPAPYVTEVDTLRYNDFNFTVANGSDTYLWHDHFNLTAGDWVLSLGVVAEHCYQDPILPVNQTNAEGYAESLEVYFSVAANGSLVQPSSLVAATGADVCGGTPSARFNITNMLPSPQGRRWFGGVESTCPNIALETPRPDPCRVRIDEAAAESVLRVIQADQCRKDNASVGCPGYDAKKSAGIASGAAVLWSVATSLVLVGVAVFAFVI